jgi:hypothetical protein
VGGGACKNITAAVVARSLGLGTGSVGQCAGNGDHGASETAYGVLAKNGRYSGYYVTATPVARPEDQDGQWRAAQASYAHLERRFGIEGRGCYAAAGADKTGQGGVEVICNNPSGHSVVSLVLVGAPALPPTALKNAIGLAHAVLPSVL